MTFLADIFKENMVLQREKLLPVWGHATPGAVVKVDIQGKSAETHASEDGSWRVELEPLETSVRERLRVIVAPPSSNAGIQSLEAVGEGRSADAECEVIIINNVAVGEVWIAGGQSNMEFWMRYEKHRGREGGNCPNLELRFYDVPKVCYDNQLGEFDYSRMGFWRLATEEELDYFSAVGYYFGKEINEYFDCPVGIIGCNWGGTVSAAWMSAETVEKVSPAWMEWFHSVPEYQDMEAYLAAQHGKPVNDHGNPFGDLFLETVMPVTMEYKDAGRFLLHLPEPTASIYEDYEHHPQPQSIPGSLFEHMVRPLAPFAVRGVLWYQGEGDDEFGLAGEYGRMLTGLIGDWRDLWHDETLPFLIVQLPGFSRWLIDISRNNFMEIRRRQQQVCDSVPHTWLCSASDAGAEYDAHPKDKEPIGHRLALLAENHVYGEYLLSDAPRLAEAKMEGKRIILTFKNVGDGLFIYKGSLEALVITSCQESSTNAVGDDNREGIIRNGHNREAAEEKDSGGYENNQAIAKKKPEDAQIAYTAMAKNDQLILTLSEPVDGPIRIAFARTSWYKVNLYNSAGIPAIPFEVTVGAEYQYFSNKSCEYFPCHPGADPEDFNCLFCYCPLYALGDACGGDFTRTAAGVKDCSNCLFPHRRENYAGIMRALGEA